jgi:flagellar L-ring protein precursor FlgH
MTARWAVLALAKFMLTSCFMLTGCGTLQKLSEIGRPPEMTKSADPTKDPNYRPMTMPMPKTETTPNQPDALWRQGSRAFFKDQRAAQVGDLVTIVVSMTDSATLNNVTTLTRTSGDIEGMPTFPGLTNRLGAGGGNPSNLMNVNSSNNNTGNGQIQRNEAVALRLAGVITQVLPNGNLVVAARQEFVVNSELRELKVTGVIRPQDIASDNTVLHDRMAEARIEYGGRGEMTELQTTRWGQQLMDILLPF